MYILLIFRSDFTSHLLFTHNPRVTTSFDVYLAGNEFIQCPISCGIRHWIVANVWYHVTLDMLGPFIVVHLKWSFALFVDGTCLPILLFCIVWLSRQFNVRILTSEIELKVRQCIGNPRFISVQSFVPWLLKGLFIFILMLNIYFSGQ